MKMVTHILRTAYLVLNIEEGKEALDNDLEKYSDLGRKKMAKQQHFTVCFKCLRAYVRWVKYSEK